jgi:hypothetical protein
MRRMVGALLFCLGSLGLLGCSNCVRRGAALYEDARYIEAAEVFERNEFQLRELSARQRAEYGLYRGMTLHALGDLSNAERWMKYAYAVERANPGCLTGERRSLLDEAWTELARTSPEPADVTPRTALAATEEPSVTPSSVARSSAPASGPARH